MDIFKKLNYILDKKQKINIVVLAVMIFIGGILETLSISAMLSYGLSLMQSRYKIISTVNGSCNSCIYRICRDLSSCF